MVETKITTEQIRKANEELIRQGQLEQIFWEKEKGIFVPNKGKKSLEVKPIGVPKIIRKGDPRYIVGYAQFELEGLIMDDKKYKEANAFLVGELYSWTSDPSDPEEPLLFTIPLQFYKIIK